MSPPEKRGEGPPEPEERPRQKPEQQRGAAKMQRGRPEDLPETRREPGQETSDTPARGVLRATAAFFLALFLAGGLVWGVLGYFRDMAEGPLVTEIWQREIMPPEPRLEVAPELTRLAIEAEAFERIQGFAWVDREAGIARVPVEEAMRLLAGHGWPDPFRPGEVAPPRAAIAEREIPRAGENLLPMDPGREDRR